MKVSTWLAGGLWLMAGAVSGAGVYTASVPAGVTNTLAEAFVNGRVTSSDAGETASLAGLCKAADLRIDGAGLLVLDADLKGSGFTGEVHVVKGARARLTANGALGDTAHGTFVADGATLENLCADTSGNNKLDFSGESLSFAGAGADGLGALVALTPVMQERNGVWGGTKLTMTGDATIAAVTGYQDFPNNSTDNSLNMNGHTLTITGYRGVSTKGGFCIRPVVTNPGHIVARHCPLSINDCANLGGGAANTLTLTDWSTLELYTCTTAGKRPWTILVTPTAGESALQTSNSGGVWDGPIRYERVGYLNLYNQSVNASAARFLGPLTTVSNLTVRKVSKDALQPSLTLAATNNAFGAVFTVTGADLVLAANGALPAATPRFVLDNANVRFDAGVTNYALPKLEAANAVQVGAAAGAWVGVQKTGAGALTYAEGLAPTTIDLEGGSFAMTGDAAKNSRAFYAGLHYGHDTAFNCWWNDPSVPEPRYWAAKAVNEWKNATVVTNSVVTDFSELATVRRELSATYFTGYIMNPEPTNLTWRFASSMKLIARLIVNGKDLGKQEASEVAFYNATLKPGANAIDYRVSANGTRAIDTNPTNCASWTNGYGFAVCKTSTTSSNSADFVELVDPGDGSVLRRYLEGTQGWVDAATALSNDVQTVERLTTYAGAPVDLGGTRWRVARLEGCPVVTSAKATYRPEPSLTVTGTWAVDAATLLAGKPLTCGLAFAFAPGATIALASSKKLRGQGAVTALVSETKIEGDLPDVTCADGGHAETILSADGKTLSLKYLPKGFSVILK